MTSFVIVFMAVRTSFRYPKAHVLIWSATIILSMVNSWGLSSESYGTWLPLFRVLHYYGLVLVFFYLNYLILLPKLLLSGQRVLYFLALVSGAFLYGLSSHYTRAIVGGQPLANLPALTGWELFSHGVKYFIYMVFSFVSFYAEQGFYAEQQKKEYLKSELSYLKAQINPHFLFNALNNLYTLTLKKSDQAPQTVLRLSQIMRYMLYGTRKNDVVLQKEIDYLQDFLALQKLRLPQGFRLQFKVQQVDGKVKVPPLLLIVFVENAFKHGDLSETGFLDIDLTCSDRYLVFKVRNRFDNGKSIIEKKKPDSGIGLKNLKRRLELVYGDDFEMKATPIDSEVFEAQLKLPLS